MSVPPPTTARTPGRSEQDCDLDAFRALVERTTEPADYPYADRRRAERPGLRRRRRCAGRSPRHGRRGRGRAGPRAHRRARRRGLPGRLRRPLGRGPGDRRLRRAHRRAARRRGGRGDHFAKPGRQRPGVERAGEDGPARPGGRSPTTTPTTCSPWSATAWLGPGYQVTSQVNVVNPGGAAQNPHRDYHLGFLSNEAAAAYPAHVHRLSPVLTLQGAVAHCDMPVESGPTLYLPYSHTYEPGYLAWRLPEFRAYFDARHVQLPLAKGDAVVLQPGPLPRRRHQPLRGHPADGQPAPGVLGVRPGHGDRGPGRRGEASTRCCSPAGAGASGWLAGVVAAPPRATPFPPTSTCDPPVDGLAPPSQADSYGGRCARTGATSGSRGS